MGKTALDPPVPRWLNRDVPNVRLVNIFPRAFDNFVATARTCYSPRGIVTEDDVAGPAGQEPSELERRRERKHALAASLFRAGHHTTLQHTHVQFALDGVSRHFLWSFLHAHPFYNSEQVSQRYVTVADGGFRTPPGLGGGQAAKRFDAAVAAQMEAYRDLCGLLAPAVEREYHARFRGRHGTKRAATDIVKRAQEVARYALPVATHAYLYHTVSVITLLRYHRMSAQPDCPAEQREVVGAMIDALLAVEPEFATLVEGPLEREDWLELSSAPGRLDRDRAAVFAREFDASLEGATSVLVSYGDDDERVLADAVRETMGLPAGEMTDDDAIGAALDPARNRLLGEAMNLTTMDKVSRAMAHPRYVFRKRLSHAADSQDQRHRMTPGSRPVLMAHYSGVPDYTVPALVATEPDGPAARRYRAAMEDSWQAVEALLADGADPADAAYLLPNAVNVRFTESADLGNLHHKMAMRLCYNAQEEIWRASLDEARAVERVHPRIGRWLLPPCGLRKHSGAKPICPEGDRYCGVPAWRLDKHQYERVI